MTEYDPINIQFVIDDHEKSCKYSDVHGEYHDHDGAVIVNLFQQDSLLVVHTIIHEVLHKAINETGIITSEEQDHNIIHKLMS